MKNSHRFLKTISVVTAISCGSGSYGITDIVSADETISDFDPYVFYEEILNEQRPSAEYNPQSFRFIDLDEDGKEEMLIKGSDLFIALYTFDYQTEQPKNLFLQKEDDPYYFIIGSDGYIYYFTNTKINKSEDGYIEYHLENGALEPVTGYMHKRSAYYKTDNKELLSSLSEDNYLKWDKVTSADLYESVDDIYHVRRLFSPWTESLSFYDKQHEFEKNYTSSIAVSGRYGYDDLLQAYKNYISSSKWKNSNFGAMGKYGLKNEEYSDSLHSYLSTNKSDVCFILRDLNGDGIRELLTGTVEYNGGFLIFDIYTIYDNRIIHLAASSTSHRYTFYLSEGNRITEDYSSGLMDYTDWSYDIYNGHLRIQGVIEFDGGKYYNYWHFNTSYEIREETDQDMFSKIKREQFSMKPQHDAVKLSDWYPGMRINEDPGDANDDGEINMLDVLLVDKYILSMSGEIVLEIEYADINMDYKVNVIDLMLLKRKLVNTLT